MTDDDLNMQQSRTGIGLLLADAGTAALVADLTKDAVATISATVAVTGILVTCLSYARSLCERIERSNQRPSRADEKKPDALELN